MNNQSTNLRLSRFGKVMRRIKENGIIREQDLTSQVTKRMQHCQRSSMHLIEDRDFSLRRKTRVMVGNLYSVGIVEERIVGDIVNNIRLVCLKSTAHKKRRQWGMLDISFHKYMKH